MDAPGSNGPAQIGSMLKAVYAKPTKPTKKTKPVMFSKVQKMLGKY